MSRKIFDCREWPGPCTLAMSGSEDEVMEAQLRHVVDAHGLTDSPAVRAQIRAALRDESSGASAARLARAGAPR